MALARLGVCSFLSSDILDSSRYVLAALRASSESIGMITVLASINSGLFMTSVGP